MAERKPAKKPTRAQRSAEKAAEAAPSAPSVALYCCYLCRRVRLSPGKMGERRFCSGEGTGHRIAEMTRVEVETDSQGMEFLRPVMEE